MISQCLPTARSFLKNSELNWKTPLLKIWVSVKVIIDKDNATIVEGAGKRSDIEDGIKQIRTEIEKPDLMPKVHAISRRE